MSNVHTNIWFASPSRISQSLKWCIYDDIGKLTAQPGSLHFKGRSGELSLSKIVNTSLVRQPMHWLSILMSAALMIAGISVGLTSWLTWQNPVTIPLIVGLLVVFTFIAGPVQWIE